MREYHLTEPVITCKEAAKAKGIPLNDELKSIILTTIKGYIVVHLLGGSMVSLRKVKKALNIKNAHLASKKELYAIGLEPGTICAVKNPTWELTHLISRQVLEKDMVSTNNGTKCAYIVFNPAVLLKAKTVIVGDFVK